MKLKDATRKLGSVRLIFFPLILLFLTAANSAFANTQVVLRTQAVSTMPTKVITYRAPATYRRVGNDLYDTRGKKYVAVRRTVVNNGNVAFRNANYTANGTRYITVRNADFDSAPRYVA